MKKLKVLTLVIGLVLSGFSANAQGLGDILKGLGGNSGIGDMVGGLIEGVFTKSDLTVADLAGSYVSEGPAISFKSDNFLQKAGGMAGAAAIEAKLKPYYQQYGLTGMTLDVDKDGNYTMGVKGIKINGTITKNESDGTFDFNITVVSMKLGKFTAFVEKSGSTLKLMFDADKLMKLVSAIAKFTGNSIASTLGSILESYDGACIGFKMQQTSSSAAATTTTTTSSETQSKSSNTNEAVSSGLDALKGLLNKGGK